MQGTAATAHRPTQHSAVSLGSLRTTRTQSHRTHVLAEVGQLRPGLALDAGAGHGAKTLWLATRGWRVTAVDFSLTAIGHA